MNISDVSAKSGLPAKTIRYYEDIGLITPTRSANGYRAFTENDTHKLVFLARSRALGFSIDDCRTLLALWEDRARASADVRSLAADHLQQIDAKIADLQALRNTLGDLVARCAGDDRPDCPILQELGASHSSGA
ncbi:MAG: Cu(I)-responsive transcriptional regulator [Pseudomonadota bacterium]